MRINHALLAEYDRLLSRTQELLALHHEEQWVSLLERWRSEWTNAPQHVQLRPQVVRTARALGGIGSISEIALVKKDQALTKVLDDLYECCRQIRYSAPW
jgi:hypothetical protein